MQFKDRKEAGQVLASRLDHYRAREDVVVLALPRGGVPVGFEVARALHAPLDIFVVRKLGYPGHEEYAMGAIAKGGIRVINPDIVDLHLPEQTVQSIVAREHAELERRERLYRGQRPPLALENHTVILIDDGLATGSTMRAAAIAVRQEKPQRVVIAVPVAAAEACQTLGAIADEIVCAYTPYPFHAVGIWYANFGQTTDSDVRALLEEHWGTKASHPA